MHWRHSHFSSTATASPLNLPCILYVLAPLAFQYYNHFATYKKCGATNYNLKPPAWDVNMYEGWAEWRVPRGAGMATILLELGFHDTQCDVLWISSDATRKLIAKAIADALDAST